MVTTSSLTQDLKFRAVDLNPQTHPEDGETIAAVEVTLSVIIEQLKPILKYVEQELVNGDRAVVVTKEGDLTLALSRHGSYRIFNRMGGLEHHGDDCWKHFQVQAIIEGLQANLAEAVRRREEHLESLQSRKDMLDQILKIVRGEVEQA